MKNLIRAAFVFILFYSCTKSSMDEGNNNPQDPPQNGPGPCDTVNMEYAADVVPILQGNCYACHGANSNSGSFGRILEGYNNLKPYAESGTLIGVISHAQGFIPMPQNGPKLSECDINKIRSWVNNGIQDN
ncbi:MAG: cytochrome c [Chitinophagaceae bacterium]|nr:cytochrome c [Chitinophagaceae bacterium]